MHLLDFLQTLFALSPILVGIACSDQILERYQLNGENGSWVLDSMLSSQYPRIKQLIQDRISNSWIYLLELYAINLVGWPITFYFRSLIKKPNSSGF